MWNFSKFSKDMQTFLNSIALSGATKTLPFTIALSKVLSAKQALPSGQVDDLENYFNMTLKLTILDTISKFNELVIVDVDKVIELTKDFYLLRYDSLFPPAMIIMNKDQPLAGFFSMRRRVANDVITCLCDEPQKVMLYHNDISKLLIELGNFAA